VTWNTWVDAGFWGGWGLGGGQNEIMIADTWSGKVGIGGGQDTLILCMSDIEVVGGLRKVARKQ
jgi:hypothetical protein